MKYLDTYCEKHVQNLYAENHKMLRKEIKEDINE